MIFDELVKRRRAPCFSREGSRMNNDMLYRCSCGTVHTHAEILEREQPNKKCMVGGGGWK